MCIICVHDLAKYKMPLFMALPANFPAVLLCFHTARVNAKPQQLH